MYFFKLGYDFGGFFINILWTGISYLTAGNQFMIHIIGIPVIQTGTSLYDVMAGTKTKLRLFGIKIF